MLFRSLVLLFGAAVVYQQPWRTSQSASPPLLKPYLARDDFHRSEVLLRDYMERKFGLNIVDVTQQDYLDGQAVTQPIFRVEARSKTPLFWRTGQDFNSLAGETMPAAAAIFAELPEVRILKFRAYADGHEWAIVELRRDHLPTNWSEWSYLRKWRVAQVDIPRLCARPLLCKFETKYPSAFAAEHRACYDQEALERWCEE